MEEQEIEPEEEREHNNEAVLHFEQVIKFNHTLDPFLSANSLFEIARLRIAHQDFYEAHYHFERIKQYEIKNEKYRLYSKFTEGVLLLIKRKVKEALEVFNSLDTND